MRTTELSPRPWRGAATCLLLVAFWVGCRSGGVLAGDLAQPTTASQLEPSPARLAAAPELARTLAASRHAYFRFVNEQWTRATCAALADEIRSAPIARLHGDAHIEQYAMTLSARGLDDFDDSARGPAAIDLVRLLGSIELAATEREWQAELPSAIDSVFDGYRRGLADPEYLPQDPAVVQRLRAELTSGPKTFVAWADSLMQPLAEDELAKLEWLRLERSAAKVNPVFTPAFLRLKKVGWLRLGIGSALDRKILARIEGPSLAVEDDVVVEAKQVRARATEVCGDGSPTVEPSRVVDGLRQLGRLRPGLLVAIPARTGEDGGSGWWVREWDSSYRELQIAHLESPAELREVAFDAGVQLGGSNLGHLEPDQAREARRRERATLSRLEPRIRVVAHDLAVELLDAWKRLRDKATPPGLVPQ